MMLEQIRIERSWSSCEESAASSFAYHLARVAEHSSSPMSKKATFYHAFMLLTGWSQHFSTVQCLLVLICLIELNYVWPQLLNVSPECPWLGSSVHRTAQGDWHLSGSGLRRQLWLRVGTPAPLTWLEIKMTNTTLAYPTWNVH